MKSTHGFTTLALLVGVSLGLTGCLAAPTVDDAKNFADVGTFIQKRIARSLFPEDGKCLVDSKSLHRQGACSVSYVVAPFVFGAEREAKSFVMPRDALKLYCETHSGAFVEQPQPPVTVGLPEFDPVLVIASRNGAFGEKQCMRYGVPVWRARVALGTYARDQRNYNGTITVSYTLLGQ